LNDALGRRGQKPASRDAGQYQNDGGFLIGLESDRQKALKNSGLTWDKGTLDRWLTNPSALVPGTKMFLKIDDAQACADIIAYLKELN
jgi:D-serine deaminase-like pyridoxal phosphate-dependent protein